MTGEAVRHLVRATMTDHDVRTIMLSTDDLDVLATSVDHPLPGQVVVGIKTADVDAAARDVEAAGGEIVKGPYDDAHERRVVAYDHKGNGLVSYSPLSR